MLQLFFGIKKWGEFMPAVICHYFLAQKVFDEINGKNSIPNLNKDAFMWGAQGPDILYCHRLFPWQLGKSLRNYGIKLHKDPPSKTLQSMQKYDKNTHDPIALSYIYGFLCHYSFDRTAHPYVNYHAYTMHKKMPIQTMRVYHHEIETALDIIVLRRETGMIPPEFDLKSALPKNSEVQEKIAELYAFVLHDLYDTKIEKELTLQATNDARTAYGKLNDKTAIKKRLLEKLERRSKWGKIISSNIRSIMEDPDYDYANTSHADWHWPMLNPEQHKDDFFDLYHKSAEEAKYLIQKFLKTKDMAALTKDITFSA